MSMSSEYHCWLINYQMNLDFTCICTWELAIRWWVSIFISIETSQSLL